MLLIKYSKQNTLIFFLLLAFSFQINAQTVINGHISDKETGEELIGASVKIIASKYGCVTDFNGDFQINTNLKLPFDIEVTYIGYELELIQVKNTKP